MKRLDASHLPRIHNIDGIEYLKLFPGALLMAEATRLKYSNGTIQFFDGLSDIEKSSRCYTRTEQHKLDAVQRLTRGRIEKHDDIYGSNSNRNKKISEKKKIWWSLISPHNRKLMIMKNFYKFKFNNGFRSSYEELMFNILAEHNVNFVEQYLLDGWLFDCYLPDYDLLIEFDGDYWHPISLESCDKEYKKRWYYRDRKKEEYAINNNYKFIRIRHSEKEQIYTIISNLKTQNI